MSEINDLREEHLLAEIARLRAEIATIRADERAKVIEECAKTALEVGSVMSDGYKSNGDPAQDGAAIAASNAGYFIARALRAKIGESNG